MVYGRWKRTYSWGTRTKQVISHWKCWVIGQEVYLDSHPYEPRRVAGPGRPRRYTDIQRKQRIALKVNIGRWSKEQQYYTGQGMWAVAARYGDKIAQARTTLDSMGDVGG